MSDILQRAYTVLLLYPDYLSDNFGQETFLTHVWAENLSQAIKRAQANARNAQDEPESVDAPEDFFVLSIFEGHHEEATQ